MTETTKRILSLQKEKALNDHQLEVEAGLPISSIQAWTKGKKRKDGTIAETAPSIDSIVKLARYFNVSADYLLCLTDQPKPLERKEVAQAYTNNQTTPPTAPFDYSNGLAEKYQHLFADDDFVKIAEVYDNTKIAAVKGILVGYFIATARANGVDTLTLVGY